MALVFHEGEGGSSPVALRANAPKEGGWPGWRVYPTVFGVMRGRFGTIPFFVEVARPDLLPSARRLVGNVQKALRGATTVEVYLHPPTINKGISERSGLPLEFFCHELLPQLPSDGPRPKYQEPERYPAVDSLAPLSLEGHNALRLANTWGLLHAPVLSSRESMLMMRNRSADTGIGALVTKLFRRRRTFEALVRTYEQQAWSFVGQENWGSYSDRDLWPSIGRAVGTSEFVRQELCGCGDAFSWAGGAISAEEAGLSYALALETTGFFTAVDAAEGDGDLYRRIMGLYESLTSPDRGIRVSPLMRRLGTALSGRDDLALPMGDSSLSIMVRDLAEDLQRYLNECLWPLRGSDPLDVVCSDGGGGEPDVVPDGSFGLSEALFIQFYNELADGNGWQQCQHCGRWFKYQRTNSRSVYLTANKRSGTQFCSKSHAVLDSRRRREERNGG